MAELVKTSNSVIFGRGLAADYDASKSNVIYFATDEHKIYMNGEAYDGDSSKFNEAVAGLVGGAKGKFLAGISQDENGNLVAEWSDFGQSKYEAITELPEGVTATPVDSLPGDVTSESPEYIAVTDENGDVTYYKKEAETIEDVVEDIFKTIDDLKLKSVAADDKVIAVDEEGVISSELGLSYDSDAKELKLTGINGEVIDTIDTTVFVKDGMLSKAEIVNVSLKEVEGEEPVYVFGDDETVVPNASAEGKYIRLSFNTDADTEDVFLPIADMVQAYTSGKDIEIAEDNSINVATSEDITLLGTTWGQYASGQTIPAGSSLTDILKAILIKVVDVTVNNPSVTLSITKTPDTTYEVGDEVAVSLSATFNDGKFTGKAEDGYGADYRNQPAGCSLDGDIKFYKNGVEMDSNEDTINVTTSVVSYTAKATYTASTNTPIMNNGTESSKSINGSTATSAAKTIAGSYKYFIGYNNWLNGEELTSDDIKTLSDATGFLSSNEVKPFSSDQTSGDGNSIVIAYPSTYELKSVDSTLGASILSAFSMYTVSYTNGNSTVDYTVAILPNESSDAIAFKNVVIGK